MTRQKKEVPEVVCGVLIINKKGEILLIKSPKWKNCFVVPGGHIEYGEKIRDAAKREALEEVGIKVEFLKLLVAQDVIFPKEFYKKKHFISLGCLCKASSSVTKKDKTEVEKIIWIAPEKALKFKLAPYTRVIINSYLKAKKW